MKNWKFYYKLSESNVKHTNKLLLTLNLFRILFELGYNYG